MKFHSQLVAVLLLLGAASHAAEPVTHQVSMKWLDHPEVLSFVFHPRREPAHSDDGRGYQLLDIPVAPNVTVGGRAYLGHPTGPTILFFHGNGEIVADYHQLGQLYQRQGWNLVAVDYRGYGRSAGQPTTTALLADARTSLQFTQELLKRHKMTGPLVVKGRSLGSAAALELVAHQPQKIAGLIIDSGFADSIGLLRRLGARIPAEVKQADFHQTEKMRRFAGPVLILHGAQDRLIPLADAQALLAAAPGKQRKLVSFPTAGHNDIFATALADYLGAIRQFLAQLGS